MKPSSRHRGRRAARRVRHGVIGIGACGIAILASACGSTSHAPPQPSVSASYVPTSAPLYLEFSTAFSSTQWQQARRLLTGLTMSTGVQHTLGTLFGVTNRDIYPVIASEIGPRVGIGVLAPQGLSLAENVGPQAHAIEIIELRPGTGARTQTALAGSGVRVTNMGGTIIDVAAHGGYVATVTSDAVIAARDISDLRAALNAHGTVGQNLGSHPAFVRATALIPPSTLAQIEVSAQWLARQSTSEKVAETSQSSAAQIPADEQLIASISSDPVGVRVQGVVIGAPVGGPQGFDSTTTAPLAGTTLLYERNSDLESRLASVRSELGEATTLTPATAFDVLRDTELASVLDPPQPITARALRPHSAGGLGAELVRDGITESVQIGPNLTETFFANGAFSLARTGAAPANDVLAARARSEMPPMIASEFFFNGRQLSIYDQKNHVAGVSRAQLGDLSQLGDIVGWTTSGAQPTFSVLFGR